MSDIPSLRSEPAPSRQVRAAAAAWLAQMHDERRSPHIERRVHAWLRESEEHRRAFERLTRAWERAGELRLRPAANPAAKRRGIAFRWAAGVGLAASLIVASIMYERRGEAVVTGVGQQQVRVLRDGTRVVLNTDTRIELDFGAQAREVRLVRGEARFDVAPQAGWPFVVRACGSEIRALGTSFIVRHDAGEAFSVTLVEGRISVAAPEATSPEVRILSVGQRLLISGAHGAVVDRPELARLTAWERGRVEFDDTPLEDATNEMNRYNPRHIRVADADVARLRVGGVFRAGDSDEFLRIITAAFGLRADRRGRDTVLSKVAPAGVTPDP